MCINKKPRLKNTRWKSEYEEFVADAGTSKVTVTLDFISSNKFELKHESKMPPYPSMYAKADGTVDMNPGFSTEYTIKGTYSIDKEGVTIKSESGETHTLLFMSGKLISGSLTHRPLEFTREGKLK
jgi:hypothetical protein